MLYHVLLALISKYTPYYEIRFYGLFPLRVACGLVSFASVTSISLLRRTRNSDENLVQSPVKNESQPSRSWSETQWKGTKIYGESQLCIRVISCFRSYAYSTVRLLRDAFLFCFFLPRGWLHVVSSDRPFTASRARLWLTHLFIYRITSSHVRNKRKEKTKKKPSVNAHVFQSSLIFLLFFHSGVLLLSPSTDSPFKQACVGRANKRSERGGGMEMYLPFIAL